MKAARVVVLTVALAAGGVAAMLAGRSEKPVEVKAPEAPQMASVDILVAKNDIAMGQTLAPGDMQWQAWPAATAAGNFIRKTDQPNAIEQFSGNIAPRTLRRRRADPRGQAGQRQGLRLHGRDPAQRHARRRDADLGGNRRRRLHPAQRPCRRDPVAARPRGRKARPASKCRSARPSCATSACWRSTRPSRRRTRRKSSSARPRRLN